MRPRIGITTSTIGREPEGTITQPTSALHLVYARCVAHAGGMPLLLPTLPDHCDAEEVLASLDGVLFSGGGDIDPMHWHEPPHPAMSLCDPQRDAFELALLRAALRRDLPMLGICRGLQVLTVATGGDLWQDIPSQHPECLPHRQTLPRHASSHLVHVVPDSPLADVLWPEGSANHTLPVNSFHHQAPRNCGTLSTVAATSPDGLVEALVIPDAHFALGVQWHPEGMAESDHRHARIFTALVSAARGRVSIDHA